MTVILRDIGGIEIDAVVNEEHQSDFLVTRHPVERGADITDHAHRTPKRLVMRAAISEHPFSDRGTIGAIPGGGRIAAAYAQLLELQASRQPFIVVTPLHIYGDMLIERLTATRDDRTQAVLDFTADLAEIIRVNTQYSTEQIRIKARRAETLGGQKAQDRASATEGRGTVDTAEVSARDASLLSALFQ